MITKIKTKFIDDVQQSGLSISDILSLENHTGPIITDKYNINNFTTDKSNHLKDEALSLVKEELSTSTVVDKKELIKQLDKLYTSYFDKFKMISTSEGRALKEFNLSKLLTYGENDELIDLTKIPFEELLLNHRDDFLTIYNSGFREVDRHLIQNTSTPLLNRFLGEPTLYNLLNSLGNFDTFLNNLSKRPLDLLEVVILSPGEIDLNLIQQEVNELIAIQNDELSLIIVDKMYE